MEEAGSKESSRRIREALRIELSQRFGQIEAINLAIQRDRGYLGKVCSGALSIQLDVLLQALEVMQIDVGRFFANALGTRVDNDSLLEDIERMGEVQASLGRLEKAAVQLELSEPSGSVPAMTDVEVMVTDFVALKGKEQRRRLGDTARYRHPAFASAYLEHLDQLRYDNPKEAGQNAAVVGARLVPRLPATRAELIALQLKAIGIYASVRRQQGQFATAARALRLALPLARRHGLQRTTAELLVRAACILSDHGRFGNAMDLLNEALTIYFDLDCELGLATVMLERGSMLYYLGQYRDSVAALKKTLRLLPDDSVRAKRLRLVAHQVLAHSYKGLNKLEQAEDTLRAALAMAEEVSRIRQASLLWDYGSIALDRESFVVAEEHLKQAADIFHRVEDPNCAMVSLDLTKALVAQGKALEAIAVATSMTRYLRLFRGNTVVDAAISQFTQTAITGKLSLEGIEKFQSKLQADLQKSIKKKDQ